jgi:hypothetical protein
MNAPTKPDAGAAELHAAAASETALGTPEAPLPLPPPPRPEAPPKVPASIKLNAVYQTQLDLFPGEGGGHG